MTPDQAETLVRLGILIAGSAVSGALAMIMHLWLHWPRDKED